MTRRTRFAGCLIFLAALGCGDNSPFSPNADERTKLDANRQLWLVRALHDYTFTLQQACFCAVNGPVRVTVQHDTVVAAVQLSNNQVVDLRYVQTITSLFDFIGRGLDAHAAVLRATYDPTLGYPTTIVYDGSLMVADDEVTYTVSGVAPAAAALTPQ